MLRLVSLCRASPCHDLYHLDLRELLHPAADKFGMTKDQAGALFDKVDTNGDGVITPKDWADYMWEKINDKDPRTRPEVKISPPMERLTAKGLRADNRAYSSVQPGRFSDPVHRGCGWFVSGVVNPKLDISQNGLVQKAEVMAAAEKFGMTVEFAAELFDRIDANGDGSITPKEWADYMWEQTISEVHLR
mmetsp:Transcript_28684/g.77217  ORF Transcript_28684/g.77217 Transcript_28684/m.77217 type:complete len:190 (-) Transcript_28684:391-960(-)